MAQVTTLARVPYTKRPVPAQYDTGWVSTELQNLQRAIPPAKSRTAMQSDTPTVDDSLVLYDATHGPITVTLRPPGQVQDLRLILKKSDSSGNAVTINGDIEGATSYILATQYKSVTVQSNGIHWYILASR